LVNGFLYIAFMRNIPTPSRFHMRTSAHLAHASHDP
jgi:hypothetical protein